MNKVKQLYAAVSDEDGHYYLVPKEEYLNFSKKLSQAERRLENYVNETHLAYQEDDYLCELRQAVWDCYDGYDCLEGEEYCVVLLKDIID